MTEIKFLKNTSSRKINSFYKEFRIHEERNQSFTIIMPSEFTTYRFGLLSDLLRLIITINSKHNIKKVIFDLDKGDIDSVYKQDYTYPIISLLWNDTIFEDNKNNNIKAELRTKQNEFFLKMNSLEKFKGSKYLLSHTDHLSQNNGLIKFLEDSNGFNDDEELIKEVVKKILLENVLTFNKSNSKELINDINHIGEIIYELSKNTFEWGKTDNFMRPISSSIRGIYFRFHTNSFEKLIDDFSNTPIESFFNQEYITTNCIQELNKIYYLEILVYDSGLGFIEKFNNSDNLSDIDIIKKCLIKNQTSSNSNLKSKKGLGLDRILNILDKKGFLKIMTDKYIVYRDLIKDNYSNTSNSEISKLKLDYWDKKDFDKNSNEKCEGSFISILFPFKKHNR
ncbi:MAG: hypothetical protein LBI72_12640 [Flavobacteriaceae bacterium]|jgi:hypothetical protein|nr:hypothetical protein [Flavobacteriaceae bacterium]